MGLGWRLVSSRIFFPNFVFSWTLFRHSAFVRFDGPIFETEKLFENLCTTRGLPCMVWSPREVASPVALQLERRNEAGQN